MVSKSDALIKELVPSIALIALTGVGLSFFRSRRFLENRILGGSAGNTLLQTFEFSSCAPFRGR